MRTMNMMCAMCAMNTMNTMGTWCAMVGVARCSMMNAAHAGTALASRPSRDILNRCRGRSGRGPSPEGRSHIMRVKLVGLIVVALALALAGPAAAQDQPWKLGVGLTPNPGGGVFVNQVFDNSPAQAVGLKPGNVIITIDGNLYNDPLQVRDKIFLKSGDTVALVYQDGADFYEVTAQLVTVTATYTEGGRQVTKAMPKAKNIQKKKVSDPRIKK
jgi:hypothetical protein